MNPLSFFGYNLEVENENEIFQKRKNVCFNPLLFSCHYQCEKKQLNSKTD